MSRFTERVGKLRARLKKEGLPGLLVTKFTNVTYLTGFTGDDSWLLVTANKAIAFSDSRYQTQWAEECPGLEVLMRKLGQSLPEAVAEAAKRLKLEELGIESQSMTVAAYAALVDKAAGVALKSTDSYVEEQRQVKDADEIEEIRRAVRLAERSFDVLRASLTPEHTEKQLSWLLESQIRAMGGDGLAFTPIIGVGDRSALPHYRPGELKVGESGILLVDWGAQSRLYKSDLTRVLVTGRIPPKLERVYRVVLKAQLAAIAAIRPGAIPEEVDAAARGVIAEAGFGKNFGHGLGHGFGLDIHELPRLAVKQKQPLCPGMVITVEPGIYLPGVGGVRIEDDVLVTRTGCEVLSTVPKDFEACIVEW